jgi:hypothetical protein
MFTNGNLAAPISALAFLGTGLLVLLLALGLVYSALKKRPAFKRITLFALTAIAILYVGALLGFSVRSHEQLLARGQEKRFCEIDCHLAYSIKDVREAKTLGEMPRQISAEGMLRIVTIQTRFDENSIGPNRGNSLLYPNPRVVSVVDEHGNRYFPLAEGQQLLEATHSGGTPMTSPLRPGEAYTTTLVFDLPAKAQSPTLLIQEGDLLTHLLIGHENSPLHKKTRFQI